MLLTPTVPVPRDWFGDLRGKRVLGLASGGGQQMPVFSLAGAQCTVLDYSLSQLESERKVAQREGYDIRIVRADMSKPLPFEDGEFDLIFHPVSNNYIKEVKPLWRECARVLAPGGVLLAGLDTGVNYIFSDDERTVEFPQPFDPTADPELMRRSIEGDWGIQFSHTLEEQLGGQLEAGFEIVSLYEDINDEGLLHDLNVKTFVSTRAIKKK